MLDPLVDRGRGGGIFPECEFSDGAYAGEDGREEGCAEGEDAPPERVAAIAPPASFSPSAMSDVVNSFEDWRTGFGALVIVAVVVLDAEFARNRD